MVHYKFSNIVYRILGCNVGYSALEGTCTYLVGTGPNYLSHIITIHLNRYQSLITNSFYRRILIDTGSHIRDLADEYLTSLRLAMGYENVTAVDDVVITHWHRNHMGGAGRVQEFLKRKTGTSPTIWKLPRSPEDTSEVDPFYSVDDFQALADGQILEVPGAKLKIMHTPGHTTDHACLMLLDNGALFSGDCIIGPSGYGMEEGNVCFFDESISRYSSSPDEVGLEDLHDYTMSLQKILDAKPTLIYPGHGPVIKNPLSVISSYIEYINTREAQILKILNEHEGKVVKTMDIVSVLYKDIDEAQRPKAAIIVSHYLKKLSKKMKFQSDWEDWFTPLMQPTTRFSELYIVES